LLRHDVFAIIAYAERFITLTLLRDYTLITLIARCCFAFAFALLLRLIIAFFATFSSLRFADYFRHFSTFSHCRLIQRLASAFHYAAFDYAAAFAFSPHYADAADYYAATFMPPRCFFIAPCLMSYYFALLLMFAMLPLRVSLRRAIIVMLFMRAYAAALRAYSRRCC